MNLREAYKVMSKASGIEVGDTVKVLRSAKTDEMGWDNCWMPNMYEAVGKEFEVSDDHCGSGFYLSGTGYKFPFFCLEVTKKATKTKTVTIGGVTKEISEESFKALKELFEEV